MIVVADTSPINYLILIDRITILNALYGRILIPHAVHEELLNRAAPQPVREWARNLPSWLELLSPSTSAPPANARLDPGELEAIALAEELHADWLLIDEAAGRAEATNRGLQTIGTLGILREAHKAGMLDLRTAVDQILAAGFRVNPSLVRRLLESI